MQDDLYSLFENPAQGPRGQDQDPDVSRPILNVEIGHSLLTLRGKRTQCPIVGLRAAILCILNRALSSQQSPAVRSV